ncbi:MAG: RNA-splicing ligase RtcB [Chloroflexi bacterium]|nr:RNA-splicing ligase RtcB [Chloroflexota bacterium]
MVALNDLKQINDFEWKIPQTYRDDMRVPVRIFASQALIRDVVRDKSLDQAVNAATLPGLAGRVVVMPDMHQGYGFPIGGVAATRYPEGVISPGGIGYDINCGVRLLASQIPHKEAKPHLNALASALHQHCPSGLGKGSKLNLSISELEEVCRDGSKWALKNGYATKSDVRRTEDEGSLPGANPSKLSQRAKNRGRSQVGSLGSGNHFIEIDLVTEIFDEKAAQVMGLRKGHLALQIHSGSRGLGHQVCSDYVRRLQGAVQRYGIHLPDRELVCAPMDSPEGEDYLSAMRCAANYAFANRQMLAHFARRAFEQVLAGKVGSWRLHQVYDVAHNIGKIETHNVDGIPTEVCVHRKGATRAFGPGAEDLPGEYRAIGQPVLVPGSMGTSSWVLRGTEESMKRTWASSCHGAGRTMSRTQAKKTVWGEDLRKELESDGIHIRARSMAGLAEEAPVAYKDVNVVVDTISQAGIATKVALLKPLAVVKG